MSGLTLLFRSTSYTELVESDKEHEDIKRLLDYLKDKIRAAWTLYSQSTAEESYRFLLKSPRML